MATPSHDYVTLWKGEHEHGVPWRGEQVYHSLERVAEHGAPWRGKLERVFGSGKAGVK